jgi:hypothetical protein
VWFFPSSIWLLKKSKSASFNPTGNFYFFNYLQYSVQKSCTTSQDDFLGNLLHVYEFFHLFLLLQQENEFDAHCGQSWTADISDVW